VGYGQDGSGFLTCDNKTYAVVHQLVSSAFCIKSLAFSWIIQLRDCVTRGNSLISRGVVKLERVSSFISISMYSGLRKLKELSACENI